MPQCIDSGDTVAPPTESRLSLSQPASRQRMRIFRNVRVTVIFLYLLAEAVEYVAFKVTGCNVETKNSSRAG